MIECDMITCPFCSVISLSAPIDHVRDIQRVLWKCPNCKEVENVLPVRVTLQPLVSDYTA